MKDKVPENWEDLINVLDFIRDCNWESLRWEEDEEKYRECRVSMTREQFLEDIKKEISGAKVVILANKFPYKKLLQNLPEVKQYVLWSNKGRLEMKEVEKIIRDRFGDKRWCWMERTEKGKSIPEIWHGHIFVEEK